MAAGACVRVGMHSRRQQLAGPDNYGDGPRAWQRGRNRTAGRRRGVGAGGGEAADAYATPRFSPVSPRSGPLPTRSVCDDVHHAVVVSDTQAAAEHLASIAGVADVDQFAQQMFEAKSDLNGLDLGAVRKGRRSRRGLDKAR